MSLAVVAAVAAAAFLLSFAGVALMERVAHRRAWLDHPTHRGLHETPTPRGGGAAVVIVTIGGALALLADGGLLTRGWIMVFVAAIAIAIVSWIDDLRSVSSVIRFGVHAAAAVAAILGFGCIERIALTPDVVFATGFLACPLAFVWIVGLTNAYNFMDGSDGIAGLQAVVAGVGMMIVATRIGASDVATITILLAAASAGFLIHNWAPAKIFMGDVGSAFLGYLLAVLVLVMARVDARALLAGALTLWPFVFDSTFTFLRRLRKRENVFAAHRSHLYQRLVQCRYSHRVVALLYGALAALGAISAIVFADRLALPLAIVTAAAIALWLFVVRTERARTALRAQGHWPSA